MDVVVGGGWAGIAAAVELARHGRPVTLIEAADRLGGRARRVDYRGHEVDNGQHLVIGAYHTLLELLAAIGVKEEQAFERRPLELRLRSLHGPEIRLRLPRLPAPLHLLAGLISASGLSAAEKRRALRFCLRLQAPAPRTDRSVLSMLEDAAQPETLIRRLWEPLCLATLNAPAATASAEVFRRVLFDAFARRRADSDLLIARADLGRLFPEPAHDFILRQGGRIRLGQRVTALRLAGERIGGVELANGESLAAAHVVLAVPPPACLRLIEPLPALSALAERLERMDSAPICTIYLQYPAQTSLPFPLVGLHGATAQWVCDLAVMGRPGLMSVVISGAGDHMETAKARLVERIGAELAAFFPDWPAPQDGFVLRERRATFLCSAGVNALRPAHEILYPNCHIAGDATATGYPATLEGAVRSGVACARRILRIERRDRTTARG